MSSYFEKLKSEGKVLEIDGKYFRIYKKAFLPLVSLPLDRMINHKIARKAFKANKALLLRYSILTSSVTNWWSMVCREYSFNTVKSKTRNQVRRGRKNNFVKNVNALVIANEGYSCYQKAFDRYSNAQPMDEESFKRSFDSELEADYRDYWAVYDKSSKNIVGYAICMNIDSYVLTSVIKLDPEYMRNYTSYALMHTICEYYTQQNKVITNGERSIDHDTNFQDFLLKFSFKKEYGKLIIIYSTPLKIAVTILYPLRKFLSLLPDRSILHTLFSLLKQEHLRRGKEIYSF